jgi:hypothetical protein
MQLPFVQVHTAPFQRKDHGATLAGKVLSDECIRNMPVPQQVNGLQWDLSSTEERRQLLEADQSSEQTQSVEKEDNAQSKPPVAAEPEEDSSEGSVGAFIKGAVGGDYYENDSWSATAGKFVGGFHPAADARDISAAATHIAQGKDGAWADLGWSLVGSVPLVGDTIKAVGKGADVAKAAGKSGDDIAGTAGRTVGKTGDEVTASGKTGDVKSAEAGGVGVKSDFKTHGVNVDPSSIPEGRALMKELKKANPDMSRDKINDLAKGMLESGKDVPVVRAVKPDETLYKIVPKGDNVSDYTPYFTSKKQLDALQENPKNISDTMGLPKSSEAAKYDVYQIKPKEGKTPKVFDSKVASTTEGQTTRKGGGDQTIVPNRPDWTTPEKVEGI